MDEFRKELEERLERVKNRPRSPLQRYSMGPNPDDVVEDLLTDLLEEYDDRHHPPRRDTPMTVDEASDWVTKTPEWEPGWCSIQQGDIADGDHIDVFTDEGYMATVSQGGVSHHHRGSLTARLLPILDRICRETGWGGR